MVTPRAECFDLLRVAFVRPIPALGEERHPARGVKLDRKRYIGRFDLSEIGDRAMIKQKVESQRARRLSVSGE
jgi:hypothetical protein